MHFCPVRALVFGVLSLSLAAAVVNPQQVNQKFIDLMANGAKPTTVQPAGRSAGASKGNLPRGSLVDILA